MPDDDENEIDKSELGPTTMSTKSHAAIDDMCKNGEEYKCTKTGKCLAYTEKCNDMCHSEYRQGSRS